MFRKKRGDIILTFFGSLLLGFTVYSLISSIWDGTVFEEPPWVFWVVIGFIGMNGLGIIWIISQLKGYLTWFDEAGLWQRYPDRHIPWSKVVDLEPFGRSIGFRSPTQLIKIDFMLYHRTDIVAICRFIVDKVPNINIEPWYEFVYGAYFPHKQLHCLHLKDPNRIVVDWPLYEKGTDILLTLMRDLQAQCEPQPYHSYGYVFGPQELRKTLEPQLKQQNIPYTTITYSWMAQLLKEAVYYQFQLTNQNDWQLLLQQRNIAIQISRTVQPPIQNRKRAWRLTLKEGKPHKTVIADSQLIALFMPHRTSAMFTFAPEHEQAWKKYILDLLPNHGYTFRHIKPYGVLFDKGD